MAFSLTDFVQQIRKLENLLSDDFQKLSAELRNKRAGSAGDKLKLRLVEQLQYHDILRQKLEHVRHFGEGLAEGSKQSGIKNQKNEFDALQVELSLALLRFTNMEYQEVSRNTHQLLFSFDKNTCLVSENPVFETEIGNLIRNLENLYLEMDTPENQEEDKDKPARYRKILDSFSMKTERDVFAILFNDESTESTEEESDPEGQIELF